MSHPMGEGRSLNCEFGSAIVERGGARSLPQVLPTSPKVLRTAPVKFRIAKPGKQRQVLIAHVAATQHRPTGARIECGVLNGALWSGGETFRLNTTLFLARCLTFGIFVRGWNDMGLGQLELVKRSVKRVCEVFNPSG